MLEARNLVAVTAAPTAVRISNKALEIDSKDNMAHNNEEVE